MQFTEGVMAVTIVGTITLGIYRLFELFVRKSERMAIIDKINAGVDLSGLKENMNMIFFKKPNYSSWGLRAALLMIGIGLGMVIGFTVVTIVRAPYIGMEDQYYRINDQLEIIYPACISIFGGLGLFIAYMIEQKKNALKVKEDKE